MTRLSSMFFMLSLLSFYIPKIFKIKNKKFINFHIVMGIMSFISMLVVFIRSIGTEDFIKYLGFTLILIGILISGYFKRNKKAGKIHLIITIGFFLYLIISINFL